MKFGILLVKAEMPEESAISLKCRTDKDVAKQLERPHLITRPPIQRPPCWKPQEYTDMIDTVSRGWHVCPIFIIKRENDEGSEEEEVLQDEVFDGAHKIETVIKFMNNEFKIGKVHETSPLFEHMGKEYKDLPLSLRQKISNYTFTINIIDSETANNKDCLRILWERYNKGGKKLNDYELALPVISDLVNLVLTPSSSQFFNSEIFKKDISKRGEVEKILQMILATGEGSIQDPHMRDFTSKKNLVKRWQDKALGKDMTKIKENTENNKDKWLSMLKKANDYMGYLSQANCFVNDEGVSIIQYAHRGTELVFLLSRSIYHFPKPEDFRRICSEIAVEMKNKYLASKTPVRDEAGRNGILQKRLLKEIDELVAKYAAKKEKRCFSKEIIAMKLSEQEYICPLCKKGILPHHKYDGDHIKSWSEGGTTEPDNCQVTHSKCNKVKA